MLHVNFNTYGNYKTDSLYQWDINQVLNITGVDVENSPEIHFSNANMDRAVVRQANLSGGVITVNIPNSLLQMALTIKAYIGIYEGETFKIIETIEIPVIPRTRPYDYVFEDTDGEIYSYNTILTASIEAQNSAKRAEQASANAVSEALSRAILKSDIVEIKKVSALPENPSDNVLYVIV